MKNEHSEIFLKCGRSGIAALGSPKFKITDRYGDTGVLCKIHDEIRPAGVSLASLFNINK